jgi:hypothetical protein
MELLEVQLMELQIMGPLQMGPHLHKMVLQLDQHQQLVLWHLLGEAVLQQAVQDPLEE